MKKLKYVALLILIICLCGCSKTEENPNEVSEDLLAAITLPNGLTQIEVSDMLTNFTRVLLAPSSSSAQHEGLEGIREICTESTYRRMENALYYVENQARIVNSSVKYGSAGIYGKPGFNEIVDIEVSYGSDGSSKYLIIFEFNTDGMISNYLQLELD